MRNRTANPEGDGWSEMEPHDKFLELCAISTSGDLTAEEQKVLQGHLAECPECRHALKEFEAAAGIGMPLLHPHLSASDSLESVSIPSEVAKAATAHAASQMERPGQERDPIQGSSALGFSHRNGDRHMQVNWNYVWMPFAAAVVLTVALGIYSFQVGKRRGQEVVQATPVTSGTKIDALEQTISDAGHDREVLQAQLAGRDRVIAELRRQIADQTAALDGMKSAQASLEHPLQTPHPGKHTLSQERSSLSQQLENAQTSMQRAQAELDSLRRERGQDQSRA